MLSWSSLFLLIILCLNSMSCSLTILEIFLSLSLHTYFLCYLFIYQSSFSKLGVFFYSLNILKEKKLFFLLLGFELVSKSYTKPPTPVITSSLCFVFCFFFTFPLTLSFPVFSSPPTLLLFLLLPRWNLFLLFPKHRRFFALVLDFQCSLPSSSFSSSSYFFVFFLQLFFLNLLVTRKYTLGGFKGKRFHFSPSQPDRRVNFSTDSPGKLSAEHLGLCWLCCRADFAAELTLFLQSSMRLMYVAVADIMKILCSWQFSFAFD